MQFIYFMLYVPCITMLYLLYAFHCCIDACGERLGACADWLEGRLPWLTRQ